jgi:hypothetical protein
MLVIPAKAGIQIIQNSTQRVDKAKGMIDKQTGFRPSPE